MESLILVGGMGTRLRSVVKDVPKPMADICGKPFLEHLMNKLNESGFTHTVMAVGYLNEIITDHFGSCYKQINIDYAVEKELLGTAGAIQNSAEYLKEDCLVVMNGDTYFDVDFNQIMSEHIATGADITFVLRNVPDASRYGQVVCNEAGDILEFKEKSTDGKPGLINGGIYVINRELLQYIPKGKVFSFEQEFVPILFQEKRKIKGIISNQYFIDIGIPDDYARFIDDMREGRVSNGN